MLPTFLRRNTAINTIYDCFRPFYRCTQLFGFVGFAHRNRHFDGRTVSYLSGVCLLLNCTICIAGLWMLLPHDEPPFHKLDSTLLRNGAFVTFATITVAQLVSCLTAFHRRRCFVDILHRVHAIDQQLRSLNARQFDYTRHYWVAIAVGVYIAVVMLLLTVIFTWSWSVLCSLALWQFCVRSFVSMYTPMAYCSLGAAISLGLLAVCVRIEALNDRIAAMDAGHTDARTVQSLARCYESLNAVIEQCNQFFSVTLVFCFGAAFATNIVSLFAVYTLVVHAAHLAIWPMIVATLVWDAHILGWVLMVANAGDRLAQTGRRTGRLIHRHLSAIGGDTGMAGVAVERRLEAFSAQVLHRHPTARCHLFALDYSVMLAASCIYLVVLVQFDSDDVSWIHNSNMSVLLC